MRINEEEYEEFLQSQKKFFSTTGDHETLLKIYEGWIKCEDPDEYCDANFLNFRALRQTDNIKNQLYEILNNNVNLENCRKQFLKDANYEKFIELKKNYKEKDNMPEEYVRTILRRNLAMSFYYNTARLTNNEEAYMLNYP